MENWGLGDGYSLAFEVGYQSVDIRAFITDYTTSAGSDATPNVAYPTFTHVKVGYPLLRNAPLPLEVV